MQMVLITLIKLVDGAVQVEFSRDFVALQEPTLFQGCFFFLLFFALQPSGTHEGYTRRGR
jgi:hypothetical protein